MKNTLSTAAAIALTIVALATPSSGYAGVFYQYTGNPFTFVDPTLGAPFAGSRMSALVEISNPTGGARVGTGCNPSLPCGTNFDSWSISAGPTTITNNTPGIDDVTPFFVLLSADASTIELWGLAVLTPLDPLISLIETTFDGNVPPASSGTIDLVFKQSFGTLAKAGPNDAGIWERLEGLRIPEPTTLAILGLGLARLGAMRRRREGGKH